MTASIRVVDPPEPVKFQPVAGVRQHARPVPDWVKHPEQVAKFIKTRFPRGRRDCLNGLPIKYRPYCNCAPCRHSTRAELWEYLIDHYFRKGKSAATCRFELNQVRIDEKQLSVRRVEKEIEKIRLAYAGRRLDRKARTTGRPGRPRKPSANPAALHRVEKLHV